MLQLTNLSIGYNERYIIQNINLSFEAGMIYSILGKNGSGKSTLLKTCSGLIKPKTGTVLLKGIELEQYSHNDRAKTISYLSQSTNTPNITVERLLAHARFPHLTYPKKLQSNDVNIMQKSLNALKVADFAKHSLRQLSGGERQRVYLAMQLAQDAPIMLLDEPTTYLDIEHQLALMKLLQELKAQGKTIIMVLHDIQQALSYSDRIIAINEGQVVDTGTPDEILNNNTLKKVFHVDVKRNEFQITL